MISAPRRLAAGLVVAPALAICLAPPLIAAPLSPEDIGVLAGPCANCHGPDGVSPGDIPSIAGRDAAMLGARMLAFRDGSAPDGTVMPRLMKGYSPDEIDALAAWFAASPRKGPR